MDKPPTGPGARLALMLKLIASGPDSFALREIAARSALPPSSVHRLLKILERTGIVERGHGQTYRTGRELHRIASQVVARFDLARSARPLLRDLTDRFEETALLCVYSPASRRAVVTEVAHAPRPLRFRAEKGREIALPWGSMGPAILAFLHKGEIEMVLRTEHAGPWTGMARPVREKVEAGLEHVRRHGHLSYREPELGLAGVAAPIFGAENEILGCLAVITVPPRFSSGTERELAVAVRDAARKLTRQAAISIN